MTVKNTRARTAEKQISKVIAYKRTFASENGLVVLDDLMDTHFVLSNTMGKSPHETAFKEGQRNVILRILKVIGMNPSKLRERIKEIENDNS